MDIKAGVELDCSIWGPTELELQISTAAMDGLEVSEHLAVELGGEPVELVEAIGEVDTRVHSFRPGDGRLAIRYSATISASADTSTSADTSLSAGSSASTSPSVVSGWEVARFRRPSRYCESDLLGNLAADIVADVRSDPAATVVRISDWVADHFRYTPGVTGPSDTARSVLIGRRGVCRDYTHAVVALARAIGFPARYVCVYAPGLSPMDLHAVAEIAVEGRWYVVDATRLAPRQSLVRIATGMDAADVSFLTNYGGICNLHSITAHASVDGDLPVDDHSGLVPAP